jgi:hypothetical protein
MIGLDSAFENRLTAAMSTLSRSILMPRSSRHQYLYLQSLPNVHKLPSLKRLSRLRRVVLMAMKGLHDFGPLEFAPALEEFGLFEADGNQPAELEPVLRNPTLQRAEARFGSLKKNEQFDQIRNRAGLEPFIWLQPFEYDGREA